MFQDRFDDPLVLNHADNPHLPLACWAGQGVHFVDLLNQLGPILSMGLRGFVSFQNMGDQSIHASMSRWRMRRTPGTTPVSAPRVSAVP